MRFFRQFRFVLFFLALLVFCSVMVIRELAARQSRHVEVREAFIFLHTTGYTNEAERIYQRLLRDVKSLSDKELLDDFQRTILLVDPGVRQPENRIWVYHWTVSNELQTRSERTLLRALKIAGEQ